MWPKATCESWTIKKTECQRIDAFELWCWRRLLRVPWTARRPNQSILKEINPECSLEGLMLKLQYLAPWCNQSTYWKRPWYWKRLRAGGEGGNRGWGSWMASPAQWTGVWINAGRWWRTGKPGVLQSMGLQRIKHDWVTEQQQQCITTDARDTRDIELLMVPAIVELRTAEGIAEIHM